MYRPEGAGQIWRYRLSLGVLRVLYRLGRLVWKQIEHETQIWGYGDASKAISTLMCACLGIPADTCTQGRRSDAANLISSTMSCLLRPVLAVQGAMQRAELEYKPVPVPAGEAAAH